MVTDRRVDSVFRGVGAHVITASFILLKVAGLLVRALRSPGAPITAKPTDLRQIDQAIVAFGTADEPDMLAAAKAVLAFQQAHPEALYYTRTRIYLAPYLDDDGAVDSSKRLVTFFDEFDNYPTYFASLLFGMIRKPALLPLQLGMFRHARILDARTKLAHTTWTEREELRVEVKSRAPLYPRGGGEDAGVVAYQRIRVVATANLAETLTALRGQLAYEEENAGRFFFSRARAFTAPYPGDREKTMVMVFYETGEPGAYSRSFSDAAAADPAYRALVEQVDRHVLDDVRTGVTTWTEQEDLRVRYEFREPLYPSPGEEQGTEPPLFSPGQPATARETSSASVGGDRRTITPRLFADLAVNVPAALGPQIVRAADNLAAALQTQDQEAIARSIKLGFRRIAGAGVGTARTVSSANRAAGPADTPV
jgi:hypothetical protein